MLDQTSSEFPEYEKLKQNAQTLYSSVGRLSAPAFNQQVLFTPEGFNHLVSADGHKEREQSSQALRFKLLPLAIKLLKTATTYQEYEQIIKGFEVKGGKGRFIKNKPVHYWGIIGIVDGRKGQGDHQKSRR